LVGSRAGSVAPWPSVALTCSARLRAAIISATSARQSSHSSTWTCASAAAFELRSRSSSASKASSSRHSTSRRYHTSVGSRGLDQLAQQRAMPARLVGARRRAEQRERLAARCRARQPRDLLRLRAHLFSIATAILIPADRRLSLAIESGEQLRRWAELLPP